MDNKKDDLIKRTTIPYVLYDFVKISATCSLISFLLSYIWNPLVCRPNSLLSQGALFSLGGVLIHGILYFGINNLFLYWEKNG